MMATPALTGMGFAVPDTVRTNADPIFNRLKQAKPDFEKMFSGLEERRVLGPGENVTSLMARACQQALDDAGVVAAHVDALVGYGSVAEFTTPNTRAAVHHAVGLRSGAFILPVADEFTNFNSSLLLADALVRTGTAATVLIVCGGNWTQFVDYTTEESFSAADGAGAAVVAMSDDPGKFRLVAHRHLVSSADYGAMFMGGDEIGRAGDPPVPCYRSPTFHIADKTAFQGFGGLRAPDVVVRLLEETDTDPAGVTLIPHQASDALFNAWKPKIGSLRRIDTLATFGNMTLASIPVTLAARRKDIGDYVVLFGLGVQLHASAVLLERG